MLSKKRLFNTRAFCFIWCPYSWKKRFWKSTVFDNSYYKILLEKPWRSSGGMSSMIGLPSDRALVGEDECLRWIKIYADNQNIFFEALEQGGKACEL